MAVTTIEQPTDAPEPRPAPEVTPYPWRRGLLWAGLAYLLSRAAVLAGAGAASAAERPRPASGLGPIVEVLTSWDGLWYFEVVRTGYPRHIPPDVTFNDLEARAAFFPLYPRLVWVLDKVLPGPVNIGNPHEVTMRELAELVVELTGSSSPITTVPIPPGREGDPVRRRPDITRARELLGWTPVTDLRDGLQRTIDALRREVAATG